MGPSISWLFGRRTYDDMVGHWNAVGGPFRNGRNLTEKFVVSSEATTPLRWPNSTLVTGEIRNALTELREEQPGSLVVMGSGALLRSLLFPAGLVDTLLLIVHPKVLGTAQRLFSGSEQLDLRLEQVTQADGGLMLARYAY